MLAGKTEGEKTQILANRSLLNGEDLVKHLFDNIGPRYTTRNGGYTRITKSAQDAETPRLAPFWNLFRRVAHELSSATPF